MNYKLLLLFVGVLFFSCNTDNGPSGFVEVKNSDSLIDFIESIEAENDDLLINVEFVEVVSSGDENLKSYLRIISIKNEETVESLYFHLNVDEEGYTTSIASMQYEFYEDDEIKNYSYSIDQSNEDNPQLLDYTIIESTETRFNTTLSGILSSFDSTDNTYLVLDFSNINVDFIF